MSFSRGTPLCPAGHLPLKGGDQTAAMLRQTTRGLRGSLRFLREGRTLDDGLISPLEGEMPGRAEGGAQKGRPRDDWRSAPIRAGFQ